MQKIGTLVALLAVLCGSMACDSKQLVEEDDTEDPGSVTARTQVLGVCFMEAETCVTPYVDQGPYEVIISDEDGEDVVDKTKQFVPRYVFPSLPERFGGIPNPADPQRLYRPFRLQNNVFAGPGFIWEMWEVRSGNLNLIAEPEPGVILWGVDAKRPDEVVEDGGDYRVRDLYAEPYLSEEEVLEAARVGDIKLINMQLAVDCPVRKPEAGDIIVNLNSNYPLCPLEHIEEGTSQP